MSKIIINSYEEFHGYLGKDLGHSQPHKITQDQINLFADATVDHQWIHTDPSKAAEGPFGGPIAHGYLSLSMIPHMWNQILEVNNLKMMVNYGIEKLRFTQPVPVDSELVLKAHLHGLNNLRGVIKAEVGAVMEIVGNKKPAFSGTLVMLYHFND
ncbi:MAG: MaoC family dehydratase [Bacteroidota bacterium]